MKKLLLLLLLSLFSFNSHAYSVDVIFTVIEQEVIVFKCDDLTVDLSFPVADEINPEDEYPTILEYKLIEKDLAPDNPLCIEAELAAFEAELAAELAENKYLIIDDNGKFEDEMLRQAAIEALVQKLTQEHDVIQINDPPSDSWKCKKGYIKRGNRCINEEEFQEAFEANIRLFVDGPDGYIIQGGVCKGVGCPN